MASAQQGRRVGNSHPYPSYQHRCQDSRLGACDGKIQRSKKVSRLLIVAVAWVERAVKMDLSGSSLP